MGMIRTTEEHASLLADFYGRVWDSSSTEQAVLDSLTRQRGLNRADPGELFPNFVYEKAGQALGHVGTIPLLLWHGREQRPAHWVKGLMVLPDHQKGPFGFLLLRHAVSQLPVSMVIVGSPEARGLLTNLGYHDLGPFPNHLKVVRASRFLSLIDLRTVGGGRFPGWMTAILRGLQAIGLTRPLGGLVQTALDWRDRIAAGDRDFIVGEELTDEAIDTLWETAREGMEAAAVRDARALRDAYSGTPYRLVGVRIAGDLRAVAVVRAPRQEGDPRLNGIRVATLSDLLCDPRDEVAMTAALDAACVTTREVGGDALLCSATHPSLRSALRASRFLGAPPNLNILIRSVDDEVPFDADASRWWFLRGDSRADDVF